MIANDETIFTPDVVFQRDNNRRGRKGKETPRKSHKRVTRGKKGRNRVLYGGAAKTHKILYTASRRGERVGRKQRVTLTPSSRNLGSYLYICTIEITQRIELQGGQTISMFANSKKVAPSYVWPLSR